MSKTHLAHCLLNWRIALLNQEDRRVIKKTCLFTIPLIAALGIGCSTTNETTNANANTATATQPTTAPGPDNSEISTSVDASGTRTETRTFRDNPRVQKVTVTTRNGVRTVKVTSKSGEE